MTHDHRQTDADFHDHLYGGEAEHVERSTLIRALRRRIVRELVPLGFGLPGFPRLLAPVAMALDALRRTPQLRARASSFEIFAMR
jgi:hypothetical protein